MFREECPEFLNIRLGCWCSNGDCVSRAVWILVTIFATICDRYTRLQTVWSLPGHSRQANKGHSPRCHRRPNGPGRLADKVVQPTTQSAEGCTSLGLLKQNMCPRMTSTWWSSLVHRKFPLPKLVNPYWNMNRPENPKWTLGIGCRLQETYLWKTKFNNKYQNDLHLTSLEWHWCIFKCFI